MSTMFFIYCAYYSFMLYNLEQHNNNQDDFPVSLQTTAEINKKKQFYE